MVGSRKKNEKTHEEINRNSEINNIKYCLGKVEKSREEFDEGQKAVLEKIDRLLQKEDKIDTLITTSEERWNAYLRMSGNDKDESTRMLNEQIARIDQLIERMDALYAKPLAFRRPPHLREGQGGHRDPNKKWENKCRYC
jgi:hypothetical protein